MVRTALAAALFCGLAIPAWAAPSDYIGVWEIGLGASVSTVTQTVNVDAFWEKKISETTIGPGHANLGFLYIKPDGTYELRWYYNEAFYKAPVVTGQWTAGTTIPAFADMEPITLIGAKPDPNGNDMRRNWVVGFNSDRQVQAIEDGYSRVTMKRIAGGDDTGTAPPPPVQPPAPLIQPPAPPAEQAQALPPINPRPTPQQLASRPPTSWTPDSLRTYFKGKTRAQVDAILGAPVKVNGYDAWYNDADLVFPPCPDCTYKAFHFRFTGPGSTVADQFPGLQSWRVD